MSIALHLKPTRYTFTNFLNVRVKPGCCFYVVICLFVVLFRFCVCVCVCFVFVCLYFVFVFLSLVCLYGFWLVLF